MDQIDEIREFYRLTQTRHIEDSMDQHHTLAMSLFPILLDGFKQAF